MYPYRFGAKTANAFRVGAASATQREILTCAHQPPIRSPSICKQQKSLPRRIGRNRTRSHPPSFMRASKRRRAFRAISRPRS
ncbi:hypothetical protein GD416_19385 [Burkholderia sp. BE24]|nr:hypothetical protein [Burkholderia sp. BE24]